MVYQARFLHPFRIFCLSVYDGATEATWILVTFRRLSG